MGAINHKDLDKDQAHTVYAWSDTGFPVSVTANDVGKVFHNSSNETLWLCTDTTPTFYQISFTMSAGGTGANVSFPGDIDAAGDITGGKKSYSIIVYDDGTSVAAGDGAAYFSIPSTLDGGVLSRAQAIVITAGDGGATTVDIYNVTDSVDMLTGAISIADGDTVGTVGTIDTSNDDVATDDVIRVDVTTMAASTTAPLGMIVTLEFTDA